MEKKVLEVKAWDERRLIATIVYVILHKRFLIFNRRICVFSVIRKGGGPGDIQDVIRAIKKEEGTRIGQCLRFFKLETHTSCDDFVPGEIVYLEIKFLPYNPDFGKDIKWITRECPAEVRKIFEEYIG